MVWQVCDEVLCLATTVRKMVWLVCGEVLWLVTKEWGRLWSVWVGGWCYCLHQSGRCRVGVVCRW